MKLKIFHNICALIIQLRWFGHRYILSHLSLSRLLIPLLLLVLSNYACQSWPEQIQVLQDVLMIRTQPHTLPFYLLDFFCANRYPIQDVLKYMHTLLLQTGKPTKLSVQCTGILQELMWIKVSGANMYIRGVGSHGGDTASTTYTCFTLTLSLQNDLDSLVDKLFYCCHLLVNTGDRPG